MKTFAAACTSSLLLAVIPGSVSAQIPVEPQDKAFAKLVEASERYYEGKAVVQARYRKDLAEAIAEADRIELYLLSGAWGETRETSMPEGWFPIVPYRAKTEILKTVVLTPEQRREFMPALQKALSNAEPSLILGHFLTHGIRLYSGEQIRFQTSISWDCRNFYVSYPDGEEFEQFADSEEFKKAFGKLMPIPEERKKEDAKQEEGK